MIGCGGWWKMWWMLSLVIVRVQEEQVVDVVRVEYAGEQ